MESSSLIEVKIVLILKWADYPQADGRNSVAILSFRSYYPGCPLYLELAFAERYPAICLSLKLGDVVRQQKEASHVQMQSFLISVLSSHCFKSSACQGFLSHRLPASSRSTSVCVQSCIQKGDLECGP